MAFGMSEATAPGASYNREKLKPGEHICRVRDVREHTGFKGSGFFLDFEVVSGPSGAGFQASYVVYPKNARPSDKMSYEMAYARELGKIQRAVAAASGLPAAQAGEINDARYQAAIARPVSPLKGRLILVNSVAHQNLKGEATTYSDVYPYNGDAPAAVATTPFQAAVLGAVAPANTNATPAVPSLPVATKPSFVDAMAAAGFVQHPDSADHAHNGVEVVLISDLRAKLGY